MEAGTGSAVRESQWTRWAPLAGIAFSIFFAVGIVVYTSPDVDSSAQQIRAFYDNEDNRREVIIAGYLLALSSLSLLWFMGSLRARLSQVEGAPARLTTIAGASGTVVAAMVMAAAAAFSFVAGEITFADAPVHPEIARVLPDLGWAFLLLGGGFSAITMVGATSLLILRTGAFPSLLAWFGFLVAAGLLVSALTFPIALLPLWVGVMSLVLLQSNRG